MDKQELIDILSLGWDGAISTLRENKNFIKLLPRTSKQFIDEVNKLTSKRKDIQKIFE